MQAKLAKEIALSLQPQSQEQELQEQDKKYQRIAPLAIARVKHLLADKSHYTHEARETGKQKRHQAREHKREIYNGLTTPRSPDHHQWVSKGNGMQCQQCKARLTTRSKLQDIQAGQEAKMHTCHWPQCERRRG